MQDTEVMKNKILRGQILRTLTLFYPSPVNVDGIKSALITQGMFTAADVLKPIHYLQDKQYIKLKESNIRELKDTDLIELTAKGVDLVEGTISDPGVDV